MSFFVRQSVSHNVDDESIAGTEADTVYDASEVTEDHQQHHPQELKADSSSRINFYPEWCKCFSGQSIRYPQGEHVTVAQLVRYFFQCPPHGALSRIIVFLLVFGLFWAILYFILGSVAGTHGPIMALVILEISGLFLGILVKHFGLPSLLAPLVLGIIIKNVPAIDIFEFFKFPYSKEHCEKLKLTKCCNQLGTLATGSWITPIREIALTMILTRAGLELSPKQLKKLKGVVPALAFIPCVVEAATAATLFYYIYAQILTDSKDFLLCLVAGFALAAVSPAVVVPGMLTLAKKGYGLIKGVPTLLIAASSIDDVLAISLFTLFLSLGLAGAGGKSGPKSNHHTNDTMIRNDTNDTCTNFLPKHHQEVGETWEIAGGFVGLVIGIVHGLTFGIALHFLPSRDSGSKATTRLILLLCLNITSMLGYAHTHFLSSAGSVGVLLTSFIASFGWRSQAHWKPIMHEIEHKLAHLWTLCVPILFGTIGKEMKFVLDPDDDYFTEDLKNTKQYKSLGHPFSGVNIAKIFGIILCCLLIRSIAAYLVVSFSGLNVKERIFCAMAWIPKATVQAALAPLVITTVLDKGLNDIKARWIALNSVALAVFGILLTAPLGAVAIALGGPRLLRKVNPGEIEEEFPNGEGTGEEEVQPLPLPSRRSSEICNSSVMGSNGSIQKPILPRPSDVVPSSVMSIRAGLGTTVNLEESKSPASPTASFTSNQKSSSFANKAATNNDASPSNNARSSSFANKAATNNDASPSNNARSSSFANKAPTNNDASPSNNPGGKSNLSNKK